MKTTLDIPDALYRRVKAKSSMDGCPVRSVTQRLYELWLEGAVSLETPPRGEQEENAAWSQAWLREAGELSEQIGRASGDKRLCRDILKEDRR